MDPGPLQRGGHRVGAHLAGEGDRGGVVVRGDAVGPLLAVLLAVPLPLTEEEGRHGEGRREGQGPQPTTCRQDPEHRITVPALGWSL